MDRVGGDLQLYRELAEIFLDDHVEIFDQLRAAATAHDRQRTERFAHALKAIAANVGGVGVEVMAQIVEDAARAGELAIAEHAVGALMLELDRLIVALRTVVLDESPAALD